MSETARVSCLIPAYNGERYIGEAIQSALDQTVSIAEIVVVDDGSTDGTAKEVARFGDAVVYVRQENKGAVAARNHCAKIARGEYFAFLDADDIWEKDKTAVQLERFRDQPGLGVMLTYMQNFWMPEVAGELTDRTDDSLTVPQLGGASCTMLRSRVFDEIGPLDETLRHRDIQDWILRAQFRGWTLDTLTQVLVRRRVHDRNFSRKRTDLGEQELLRLAMARIAELRRQRRT